jgi:hypothetical protein
MQVMQSENSTAIQSDLLEKVWASNTSIRTKITTVRLEKAGSTTIEIKPREVGRDTQGWSVGEQEIPVQTLEDAIIIGLEILARG